MFSSHHQEHLRQLKEGMERQIAAWERLLVNEADEHEIRKIVDGLAHLKIARFHVISLLERAAGVEDGSPHPASEP